MKNWLIPIILVLLAMPLLAEPMPDFRLPNEADQYVSLAQLLGKGPVLLDFWADYCQPCKLSMPLLHDLAEKYEDLTVVMVSIDAPKMQTRARNYLRSKNFKFVTLFDPDKVLAKKLNVVNPPHTFIMDSTGEIVYSHVGYKAGDEAEYERQIVALLELTQEKEAECESTD